MSASQAQEVESVLKRIQELVFQRRIRVKEFFKDFDKLNAGRCTGPQFQRAVNVIGVHLQPAELKLLEMEFRDPTAAKNQPQDVDYKAFCRKVDEVFANAVPAIMQSPRSTFAGTLAVHRTPGNRTMTPRSTFVPNPIEDESWLNAILEKIALLCQSRGIVLKYCFQDFERPSSSSPASVNPRHAGKVTINQFRRHFPLMKEFSEEDVNLLVERYRTEGGDINYQALHNDVSKVAMPTLPRSPPSARSTAKAKSFDWSHSRLTAVEKLKSKVVEKRLGLAHFFRDFDPLRKGYCTPGQVRTVFTILGLDKDVNSKDWQQFVAAYKTDEEYFDYVELVKEIEAAFTNPDLEKDPLLTVVMPDASSTAPARRNRIQLSDQQMARVEEIMTQLRARIATRRILMKPSFMDLDSARRGHLSKNQFTRVLHMLGFKLSEEDSSLLGLMYCDLGDDRDVNYVDFCKDCDLPSEVEATAMKQRASRELDVETARYFDARGRVRPFMGTTPRAAQAVA